MNMDRRTILKAGAASAAAFAAGPVLARDWGHPQPVRYPDPAIEVLDPSFAKYRIGNANVERLVTGLRWAEGPVYFRDGGYLVWSDIPNNRLMRWTEETGAVSVFRPVSNYTNGNTRDRQGRLIQLRARRSAGHADGVRRHHHGPDRPVRGEAAQRPERRRGPFRRRHLVHRSRLRHPGRLRGRQGRVRIADQRLSPGPLHGTGDRGGRRFPAA